MSGAARTYTVLFTDGAERDLMSIYEYIAEADSLASADHVLDRLQEVTDSLSQFPERGRYPKELIALGIREYRQTSFKPYRLIYRITGAKVIIYLIADGRRDMQSLLARRLLGLDSHISPYGRVPQYWHSAYNRGCETL